MATISVLVGSVRDGRRGRAVSDWVATTLEKRGHTVHIIDPSDYNLPLLKAMWKSDKTRDDVNAVREKLVASTAYVLVTPEYNHSYSAAIKNTLDYYQEEYHFKPFSIVSYSAGGFGGIRAAEALRPVVSELGAVTTPISLPVSKVYETFTDDGALADNSYEERLAKLIDELEWYEEALSAQREQGTPY